MKIDPPNLVKSVPDRSGKQKVAYKARLEICEACPFKYKDKRDNLRCNLCGCYMAVKALIPGAKCPNGRW